MSCWCLGDMSNAPINNFTSALSAIHDLSRPIDQSVSPDAYKDYSKYESIDDVLALIQLCGPSY